MTIYRDHYNGPITFECNGCGEILETDEDDFNEALSKVKFGGWKMKKIGNEWLHTCSWSCMKEAQLKD